MDSSLSRVCAATWLLLGLPWAAHAALSFDETARLTFTRAPRKEVPCKPANEA